MSTGQVDAILENWGHDDLRQQYIDNMGVAQSAGSTGIKGQIGWYVPPWMAEQYPDITDWRNLNKYAHLFKTSESGDKGQLLDGDPAYVTNDDALVANLGPGLQGGAGRQRDGADLQHSSGPAATKPAARVLLLAAVVVERGADGQDQSAALHGRMRRRPGQDCLRLSGLRPGQDRRDQVRRIRQPGLHAGEELPVDGARTRTRVARSIAMDGMSDDEAAKKFIDAHPQLVAKWLAGTGARRTRRSHLLIRRACDVKLAGRSS